MKEKLIEFKELSERNSKHMYIEMCQNSPGYNCSFYSVKVNSQYVQHNLIFDNCLVSFVARICFDSEHKTVLLLYIMVRLENSVGS